MRGGSFNNNRRNARCAYRNRNNPNNFNNNIGFRVVVSHTFAICRKCSLTKVKLPRLSKMAGCVLAGTLTLYGRWANIEESRSLGRSTSSPRRGTVVSLYPYFFFAGFAGAVLGLAFMGWIWRGRIRTVRRALVSGAQRGAE